MPVGRRSKVGFTLVEVLVVVAIIGVLSSMGVVSLRSAVINTRIKDAGINVTAYLGRAANDAIRLNKKLCVKASGKVVKTYEGACVTDVSKLGDPIDEMTLEALNEFTNGTCPDNAGAVSNEMTLTPRVGVSPVPEGCFMVKYGSTDRRAAAVKKSTKFELYYKLSYDSGASWM